MSSSLATLQQFPNRLESEYDTSNDVLRDLIMKICFADTWTRDRVQ